MPENTSLSNKPRILVVGGGYVGLYTGLKLQKKAKRAGMILTIVDPLPYMTYQPFLPEVIGGGIHPTNAVVPFGRHLKDVEYIPGKVTRVENAHKTARITLNGSAEEIDLPYADVIVAAGAITRGFPIDGLDKYGISVKTIEEATYIHTKILERVEQGSWEQDPDKRKRLLTFVVVGGGFNGVETMGEMQNIIAAEVKENPRLDEKDLRFVLVEGAPRIMPEVSAKQANYVVREYRKRGIEVLTDTTMDDAKNGVMQLINRNDGSIVDRIPTETLIWTAGVQANPVVGFTDLPQGERGKIQVQPDLRVVDDKGKVVENAWSAGDIAAVPDLTGEGPGGFCVPNAQHALRQTKRLAKNFWNVKNNKKTKDYKHYSLGAVAGLGLYKGVATIVMGRFKWQIPLRGFIAWLAHRGYHGLAMPTFERKFRVVGDWVINLLAKRDVTYLPDYTTPRQNFQWAMNPPRLATEDKPKSSEGNKASEVTAGADEKTAKV